MFDRHRHSRHAMWLALIAISTTACSSEPRRKRPVQQDPSKAPLIPEACTIRSLDFDCMDGLGDVAAGGMGGDIGTSEQEYSDCIVSQMLRMECPSYVSHFSLGRTTDGSLGIVAAQKGTDGLNESASAYADTRAHAHFYLFDDKLKPALALQTPADGKQLSFTIAP